MNAHFLTMSLLALVHGSQLEVTPVQKVVALLEGMLEKGKKSKQDERVQFGAFAKFCNAELKSRGIVIDAETGNIQHLTVEIRKERVDSRMLARAIAMLDRDISNWNGDKEAAAKVRRGEKFDYDALHEDYSDTVDALMRAIASLKKEKHDRKQKAGLLQVSALNNAQIQSLNLIPPEAKKAVDVFLQQGEYGKGLTGSVLSLSAPTANAYEFQSTRVIEMLQKLLEKFMDERRVIEKEQVNAKHAYDMLMKELDVQIAEANQVRERKAVAKSKQDIMKADDKGDRVDEMGRKVSDVKYESDLEATCKVKASAFQSRQKLRAEETVALEKAIKIIGSDVVAASAIKHLPTLVQKNVSALAELKKGSAFAHLRSSSKSWNNVATYLQEQAVRLNSRVLAAVAEHAAMDPFIKVKKMISDLIKHLIAQASEETDHKGWCDTELNMNEQTRKEKTDAVETLRAEIDQLHASQLKSTEEISELTKAVAEIDAAITTQTELRVAEKAKNTETISDARAAGNALEKALAVLREFYVKAAEATAFVQKGAAPEIFDDTYNGMEGKSEEVLGMLEVIQTDFARLESATKAGEAASKQEYDGFMTDSKADKLQKKGGITHKTNKKQHDLSALTSKSGDLEATQKQLDAAFIYFDKLKPSCVDAGDDYEDRAALRQEEIKSLREALSKLNGEDI